ncbi:MAG TPA: DNA helicase RecQ [bacterium]|nr:DNA helicase RecQ [bacterium]
MLRLVKKVFGFNSFLPLQKEIITNVLRRRDTLVIMPTGGGKSLCYQLPALLLPGMTIVVSPLIALMEDQVSQLRTLGIPAAYMNSSLTYSAYREITDAVRKERVTLLYVAPETLLKPETLSLLNSCRIDCLAIDEAHCISSWGHDFRPDYRRLITVREQLPEATCLALTATATPRVRDDIQDSLGLDEVNTFLSGFNRGNLRLLVDYRTDGLQQTLTFLEHHPGQSGIIYCNTRNQVETLTDQLDARGYSVLPYHAGMEDRTRRRHQQQFIRDDVLIMVATIAFGMGIDKSNVRFILHYNLPENLENYYQQIGRSGRDGLEAECLLLYNQSDIQTIRYFINEGAASERPGKEARLGALMRYVETSQCRRKVLLQYFGETYSNDTCDNCDQCLSNQDDRPRTDITVPAQKFLSCVKRTGEIFGVSHIVKVLRGSRAKRVLSRKHDQLSTYGIGTEFTSEEWKHLARQFIRQNLVRRDPQHGGLSLTSKAWQVFNGKKVYASREFSVTQSPHDKELFVELRALRKRLADAADIPAYVIFSDRSLSEMATYFPQTADSLLKIHGVGEGKLKQYGDEFLRVIRAYCEKQGLKERRNPLGASSASTKRRTGKRRFEEVGEMFAAGQSVSQIRAHYNVRQRTIINHLYRYLKQGNQIDEDRLPELSDLNTDGRKRALSLFAELGPDRLRPIYEALNETVSYDELRLLRLYYLSQS